MSNSNTIALLAILAGFARALNAANPGFQKNLNDELSVIYRWLRDQPGTELDTLTVMKAFGDLERAS